MTIREHIDAARAAAAAATITYADYLNRRKNPSYKYGGTKWYAFETHLDTAAKLADAQPAPTAATYGDDTYGQQTF